mmetsp:Transcript_9443/g.10592  ORF Transcript_9443/g.10592 Transcript_9443/m.10592 type:complete len:85 (-) Transcript_9443:43-297(-)
MKENLQVLSDLGFRITQLIRNLYADGLLFGQSKGKNKMLFKFGNRDYARYIVQDVNNIKNLIQMQEIITATNEEHASLQNQKQA